MVTVNEKHILYESNMTVADAIREAGESIDDITLVMVDGKVLPCGSKYLEPLLDGSKIKVLRIISGG